MAASYSRLHRPIEGRWHVEGNIVHYYLGQAASSQDTIIEICIPSRRGGSIRSPTLGSEKVKVLESKEAESWSLHIAVPQYVASNAPVPPLTASPVRLSHPPNSTTNSRPKSTTTRSLLPHPPQRLTDSPTMPREVSDIKQFIEICRRKDAKCALLTFLLCPLPFYECRKGDIC